MGEKEDKEKAEKLAAAKKRVAQLQKKKKAATGGEGASGKNKTKAKAKEEPSADETAPETETTAEDENVTDNKEAEPEAASASAADQEAPNEDEAAFNSAIQAANESQQEPKADHDASPSPPESTAPSRAHLARQPSISLQSKIRSASFKHGTGPLSPSNLPGATPEDGDFPDIYRKQVARIQELEAENKRLAHEAGDWEARWRKTEDTLEELREKAAEDSGAANQGEEVQKLRAEVNTLRRNSRQSISSPVHADDALRKDLDAKDSTITSLQLEISRLRTQLATSSADASADDISKAHSEQVAALQASLARLEKSNAKLESELTDTKTRLTRASEKALKDTTEQTSRETRLRELERQLEESSTAHNDAQKRSESLDKKLEALNKLHRESEARNLPKLNGYDALQKELALLKSKLESAERETLRLREARKRTLSGAGANDDAGLDELEDEDRQRLEQKIRDLEGENFDLRRGVWRDRRRDLQPNLSADAGAEDGDFDDVDLNGSGAASRKGSAYHAGAAQPQQKHSGFTQVLNSGLAAFRGTTASPDHAAKTRPRNDSLLEDFDEDAFDENAFAAAQREEEMKKMVEHVREVKKGLKQWVGWRLDLVDLRRSGGGGPGFGDVFDV